MLKIINELMPFFEDCYRRINVREYAKIIHVSPPTASNLLEKYHKENLLLKTRFKNYILYYANKESKTFIDLSRIYWREKLKELTVHLEGTLVNPTIILFGSLSKAETKSDSDVDLAVFAHKKELRTGIFEKKLKRRIQFFWLSSIKKIKTKELANNIINGYVIIGKLSL